MSGEKTTGRRGFLSRLARGALLFGLGAGGGYAARRAAARTTVWQIDPHKCVQCGRCATECVLAPSAVKCVHAFAICGYCDLCMGYFAPEAGTRDTAAESQLCPTGAIRRTFVEDPYYEYVVDESLCVGCGKCVKGCGLFGNGSLYLQIRHDRCVHCNDCRIAAGCPAGAIRRVSSRTPYLPKEAGPSSA